MEATKLKDFERELRSCVKGEVYFDEMTLGIYATDASIYQITPVAVVSARDEADAIGQRIPQRGLQRSIRKHQRVRERVPVPKPLGRRGLLDQ